MAAVAGARYLAGRVALVTGSTSGIGLGVARSLAARGAGVVVNGFGDEAAIRALVDEVRSTYDVPVAFHHADLGVASDIEGLIEAAGRLRSEFGAEARASGEGVDILVNNAGIQHVSPVAEFPTDMWDKIIAINLSAVFHTTRLCLPAMTAAGWGRVVNISSVHGLVASANKAPYVATKHAVAGFTKSVALETAGSGVTSNAVCPGWVLTPLVAVQVEAKAKALNVSFDEAKALLLSEKQPSKQFATPEHIGDTVSFLCSDSASQITGVALPVDGGWTAQ